MISRAVTRLKKRDKTLRGIINQVGPCTLTPKKRFFVALCEAIVHQQLAMKAAATIFKRFRALFPGGRPTPAELLTLSDTKLRSAGMSKQKIGYLRDLARKFADGTVPSRRLSAMDDDAVIDALTQVKGVGVWTAQMFLIFVLNRSDVLPVDDLGLRKAAQLHYGLSDLPDAEQLAELAEPWRPYRTVATWYLWQSLNS